jgi:hypothetical protein
VAPNVAHALDELLNDSTGDAGDDEIIGPESAKWSAPNAHHPPAHLRQTLVFVPVGPLAAADVFIAVATDGIQFNGDRELRHHDVGPHLDAAEERRSHPDRIGAQVDVE